MKKYFGLMVLLLFVFFSFSACSSLKISSTQTTIAPTIVATLQPTLTPTILIPPTATITMTPTETINLPITIGTKVPQNFVSISSENARNLIHIASFKYPEGNGITQITFTQDNNIVMFIQSGQVLRILNSDGSIQKTFAPVPLPTSGFYIYNLFKLSTDGKHLSIAVKNYYPIWATSIYMINLEDESDQTVVTLTNGLPVFSEDLSKLALLKDSLSPELIQMWQFDGYKHNKYLGINPAGYSKYVAISPDGSIIASEYEDFTILYKTEDGSRIRSFKNSGVPLVFSNDGSLLAMQTEKFIQIWNVADATLLQSLPYNGWVNKVAFSPNSQLIAVTVTTDILVWNVTNGTLVKTLKGDKDTNIFTNTVVFSPDGKYLAYDRFQTLEIWGVTNDGLGFSPEVQNTPSFQSSEKTKEFTIGDFNIVLHDVQITDIGWNPFGLDSNLALVVNVTETTGKLDELSAIDVWFTDNQGNKLANQATEKGVDLTGTPTFSWNLWVSNTADGYFIHFPTGEVIDLTPLINYLVSP